MVTFNQSNSVESLHISDFGTSRVFEGTIIASTIVGTQIYMSPELANNSKKNYDPFKSDGINYLLKLSHVFSIFFWSSCS